MSEPVDDLELLGIVERRRDPSDGRAKLICRPTAAGGMRTARRIIAEIEAEYAELIGMIASRHTARALNALVTALTAKNTGANALATCAIAPVGDAIASRSMATATQASRSLLTWTTSKRLVCNTPRCRFAWRKRA
jgi:hypothetical protein